MTGTWVSAQSFFRAFEEGREADTRIRHLERLEQIRKRTELEHPVLAARVAEHKLALQVGEARSAGIVGLLWYATCSCGWRARRGWRLRTGAENSWRGHAQVAEQRAS